MSSGPILDSMWSFCLANLRGQLRTRGDSDKESLARLCRIRELEEQLRKEVADAAEVAGQRDSAR